MDNPERDCPVCLSPAKRLLFRQRFGKLSAGSLLSGYNLVVCARCGSGYADDIPAQEAFDRYYAKMSKYEFTDRGGIQADKDFKQFSEVTDLVAPHFQTDAEILDIGCATGGLLAEFKRRGFDNVFGVDPSPACAELTENLYGIPAQSLTLAKLNQLPRKFELALLTGVLEHVRDVDASIESINSCLRPDAAIYVEVPDATRYDHHFSAPFQLFSIEHVNYFSPVSLGNLFVRHGFQPVLSQRWIRRLSSQAKEPSVGGLFRRSSPPSADWSPIQDEETEPALHRYLEQSRAWEQSLHERIDELVRAARPLAVWGVGTHTLRLLETSSLSKARIVSFIDSNPNYQGKTLAGHPILAPSQFTDNGADILISSQTAEEEIFGLITKTLKWPNTVCRLYGDAIPSKSL